MVENKVSKNIGLIYKAKPYLSKYNLTNLYYSFIHCYINYGNIVWASSPQSKLQKIYRKQKQMIRLISGENRYTHSRPLMKSLKLLNIYQINMLQHLIFMFEVKHTLIPNIFQDKFQTIYHKYPTCYSRNNYQIPKANRISFFRLIRRGPLIWNQFLNNQEKELECLSSFKNQIKTKLLETENEFLFY